ncbi:uncharacterized protein LOC131663910 [Phymastichus coffea]|uniref:uncharacterized protein LOC131663910 n=1 Tax=Phymastichus coffea TaxID=108790 RepID=UPI00273B4761|nr:uncharacterized protein LOC131663910 [Phymastichus coffea]
MSADVSSHGSRLPALPRTMSRYTNNSSASSNREGHSETDAPLPSYGELIGSDNPVAFKTDVLLLPANTADQGQSTADAPNHQCENAPRFSICKPNRTGIILVLIALIIIPMCGMIIILQIKVCATEQSQFTQSIDKINGSYGECTDELSALQDNQYLQENLIRDLKYQVQILTDKIKRLQQQFIKKDPKSIEE